MIKIDSTLLSDTALDNLIMEVITRQATEYGEFDIELKIKKAQLLDKIKNGLAVIVYSEIETICDIITIEAFKKFLKQNSQVLEE
jgi:uncharacterized protein YheU (UPF0270 family)